MPGADAHGLCWPLHVPSRAGENERSRDRKCAPGRSLSASLSRFHRASLTRANTQLVSENRVGLHVLTLPLTAWHWADLSFPGPAPAGEGPVPLMLGVCGAADSPARREAR